jgi:hypothetical protein
MRVVQRTVGARAAGMKLLVRLFREFRVIRGRFLTPHKSDPRITRNYTNNASW